MAGNKSIAILGTRGVPAAHGGFETFAEQLGLYLVDRGWDVTVYCQHEDAARTPQSWSDVWRGINRHHIAVGTTGPLATLDFDWRSTRDAARRGQLCLVLGYNSAIFLFWLRLWNKTILTNMDGMEWKRSKWSKPVQAWFWINEWIAARVSQHLIADHPAIARHLETRRSAKAITTIPYGGTPVDGAPAGPVAALGLDPGQYFVSIARIEPENHILEIVAGFSAKPRGAQLAVLGTFDERSAYHRAVKAAAGPEVIFPGAIYDANTVSALRYHARAYLHGHSVGGTNPSLVEALWAGNAVIAHDNAFNRWTAGPHQFYFKTAGECGDLIETVIAEGQDVRLARIAARNRATTAFGWPAVFKAYEDKFLSVLAAGGDNMDMPLRDGPPSVSADLDQTRQARWG